MALWQLEVGGERRLARGPADEGPQELLTASLTIDALLAVPDALATELHGPSAVHAARITEWYAPARARNSQTARRDTRASLHPRAGGNAWESNPPRRAERRATGFEDQGTHRDPTAPIGMVAV